MRSVNEVLDDIDRLNGTYYMGKNIRQRYLNKKDYYPALGRLVQELIDVWQSPQIRRNIRCKLFGHDIWQKHEYISVCTRCGDECINMSAARDAIEHGELYESLSKCYE